MADVFISYALADQAAAERLQNVFQERAVGVLVTMSMSGSDWRYEAGKAIGDARVVVALLTADSIRSEWLMHEAGFARKADKLLPIIVGAAEPPADLAHINSIRIRDFSEDQLGVVLNAVLRALKSMGYNGRAEAASRDKDADLAAVQRSQTSSDHEAPALASPMDETPSVARAQVLGPAARPIAVLRRLSTPATRAAANRSRSVKWL